MITRRSFFLATVQAPPKKAPPRVVLDDPSLLGLLFSLEQAQLALYERAVKLPFRGEVADLAGRFGNEESKHADRLRALGAKPRIVKAAPRFRFSRKGEFLRLAQRLEGLAVGTYNGAIPHLRDPALFQAVATIAQIEGRHSAAIRVLRGSNPAPRAFDRAYEPDRAQRALTTLLSD